MMLMLISSDHNCSTVFIGEETDYHYTRMDEFRNLRRPRVFPCRHQPAEIHEEIGRSAVFSVTRTDK